ncbi:DUF5818 domain-containing protein [Sphingomonas sp. KR1UV-12]|uniref:DUF5818 domain-containing protein n=1 Tax=Sphingomonas aurea TaxID=3063994 RepID=A0ABT9EJM1_9SPHN|nr:DUF5818 domain-containing protein [Sphingomonas sp. KR1UV-12]MDP1027037.1 DUF5818 domain-containing protein [Sphingomonas sp. KR1UV-12]
MPRGSKVIETGWLNRDGKELILRRDGGGRWRLDCGLITEWRANRMLGQRVRVLGVRDAFDVIGVTAIIRAD